MPIYVLRSPDVIASVRLVLLQVLINGLGHTMVSPSKFAKGSERINGACSMSEMLREDSGRLVVSKP